VGDAKSGENGEKGPCDATENGLESEVSVNEEQNGVSKEEGEGGESEVTEASADLKARTDAAAAGSVAWLVDVDVDVDLDTDGNGAMPGRGMVEAGPEGTFPLGAVLESGRRFSASNTKRTKREANE
jgi:hypothetical protein